MTDVILCQWCKTPIRSRGIDGFKFSIAGASLALTVNLCGNCAVKATHALKEAGAKAPGGTLTP